MKYPNLIKINNEFEALQIISSELQVKVKEMKKYVNSLERNPVKSIVMLILCIAYMIMLLHAYVDILNQIIVPIEQRLKPLNNKPQLLIENL